MPHDPKPEPAPKKCPICGKPAQERTAPFCSDRCAKVDLGRWLTESYSFETEEEPEQDTFS
ncbi:MAG: DNA gyrase inhibitor YacG [Bdellovibrionales bacterium]